MAQAKTRLSSPARGLCSGFPTRRPRFTGPDRKDCLLLSLISEFLDFSTFFSIWYWVFLALAWSSRTHWTLGAPFDSVVRAEKRGGRWEDDLDAIVHAMAARFAMFMQHGGPWVVGIAMFLLAGLVTACVVTQNEMVRGITAFAVPMMIAEFGDIRLALRIERTGLRGYDLRRALVWRRFLNQVTGLFSLILAATLAVITLVQTQQLVPW